MKCIAMRKSRLLWTLLLFGFFVVPVALSPNAGDKYDPTTLVFPTFLHTYGVRKATATHLFLYTQNRLKVRDPQGIAATRLEVWDDPKQTKDDDEITVYGVNSGLDVIIYNTSMTTLGFYGLSEKGERRLHRPLGIAAHPSGDVYVADSGNNRVVHFFNPSKDLKWVRALSNMREPHDVAISPDRTVFVTDTGNHRVLVYRDDHLIQSWGEAGKARGQLWRPSGIAAADSTDKWSFYKDNFTVVIDLDGQRLQKFARDGRWLKTVTASEIDRPNAKFMYAAVDYYSNIYVTDFNNHCIHKFDRFLNYLTAYGRHGSGDKEFIEPRGIAIYKRFGQVLVDDHESAQYYWVGTDVHDFRVSRHQSPALLKVDYFLTEPSYVTLEILDARGKVLATAMKRALRFSGPQQELIGGTWEPVPTSWVDNQRQYDAEILRKAPAVSPGQYTVRMTIAATYSSYKYFSKTVEMQVNF